MPRKKNFIPQLISNTPSVDLLLSAFDSVDRAITLFDGSGNLIDINSHALRAYGIQDKAAFLSFHPNFFDSPSFGSAFDPKHRYSKDVIAKVVFDHDKFDHDFPNISFRKGRALHYLRIHPIYDNSGMLLYIMAFSTDMTALREDRSVTHQLRGQLSYMMNAEGISTWTYDLETGNRILDSGAHLFPEYQSMDDFMGCVHHSDRILLSNLITLIKCGSKMEGHVVLRIMDTSIPDQYIFLETLCTPQIVDGNVKGIFFMTKDVSVREKKQLELAAKDKKLVSDKAKLHSANVLLHSIIDRMPCLFFTKDINFDFRYTMANSIFCNLIGKKIEQVLGHTDEELSFDKECVAKYRESDMRAIEQGSYSCHEETNIDGVRRLWSTIKYTIKANEKHRYLVCISRDVTEIYDAYAKLKIAQDEAESSIKMKTAFLQNITSELITPLNSALGFSQLLLSPATEAEREMYQKQIYQNSKTVKSIIDDIIDLSQLESGLKPIKKETFDLSEYMLNLRPEYEYLVREGIDFRIVVPCPHFMVTMDKYHLGKIVHRGIMNSIEFTYKGYVSIGFESNQDEVKIFVEDTGIGLSEEEMSTVTEHHENLNGFTESMATSLSICKIIAKAIGGTIDFTSSKGEVSRIWICFPLK